MSTVLVAAIVLVPQVIVLFGAIPIIEAARNRAIKKKAR